MEPLTGALEALGGGTLTLSFPAPTFLKPAVLLGGMGREPGPKEGM